ncbi:MAG: RNB domain-containing ribonuclease [Candidatus Promineifilaceae bacterium]
MPEKLILNSLILYKNKPGRVTDIGRKKIEIELQDGELLSVRPKDVVLLHPGLLESLAHLRPPKAGEVTTAWELLAGEQTTLAELSDLAYGTFTPATAWALWQMVEDGLYFSGEVGRILVHTAEAVAEEEANREAKAAEARAWQAFVSRVEAGHYIEEDKKYLLEVVELAWGQSAHSRVLNTLGHGETPQNAHELLLSLGYWDSAENPYPRRAGLPIRSPEIALPDLPPENTRRDLTHLAAFAIDDEGSSDPDDALSLEDGRLWVHIADAAALIPPDSLADLEARSRAANLYLPEGTIGMLPDVATPVLGLGLNDISPALSFGFTPGPEGEIDEVEIVPSWVRVTRLTYEEVESRLAERPFQQLYDLAIRYQERRRQTGAIEINLPEVRIRLEAEGRAVIRPLPPLRSRDLVREAMLMTGEAVARFALRNQIPIPFTSQEGPLLEEKINAQTPSEMFALRRMMRPSQQLATPAPHSGLGMPLYVQATSPLRRYLDLVVHQQLRAFLTDAPMLNEQEVMARVGEARAVSGSVRWAERQSNLHWTLVYLQQNPNWEGEGVLIERRGSRDVILIPDLALETELYDPAERPIDSAINLAIENVKLAYLETYFRIAK